MVAMASVTIATFADRLHIARRARHISQRFVAEEIGVSRATVSNWESGTSLPDVVEAAALAELLGVDLQWLATGDDAGGGASVTYLPTSQSVDQPCLPGLSTYPPVAA